MIKVSLQQVNCDNCSGKGTIGQYYTCPECKGKGYHVVHLDNMSFSETIGEKYKSFKRNFMKSSIETIIGMQLND